jgi:DHA1 family 2-module integral membrane pump EmrD-like MFS transporter
MRIGFLRAKSLVLLLAGLASIAQFTLDIYLPSLPSMGTSLATSSYLVKLSMVFYLFSFGGTQLFYGVLSDCYGRKKVINMGGGLYFIGLMLSIFSPSIHLLIISRILQGMGIAAGAALVNSILRDFPVKKRRERS